MLTGSRLLAHVGFPTSEVLGPDATEDQIQALIDRHGLIFVKPLFRGGVGKKGKAGLIGRARDLKTALAEKERLYFAEHRHGNAAAKANGVTFEAGIPAEQGLLRHHRRHPVPRADDDHHAPRRGGDRGPGQGRGRLGPLRRADWAEGLCRGQRPDRHRRAERDHLAPDAAPAQAVGADAPLRHDHAGTEPDPDDAGGPGGG